LLISTPNVFFIKKEDKILSSNPYNNFSKTTGYLHVRVLANLNPPLAHLQVHQKHHKTLSSSLPISSSKTIQILPAPTMDQLLKCDANYVPLTPITFLKRANAVYANRTSVIYEGTRFTWSQTYERCCRLADSLRSLNVGKNDVVRSPSFIL